MSLGLGPEVEIRPLDPLSPQDGSNLLRTFHGHHGKPIPTLELPKPPDDPSWNARYEIQKLLGHGAQGVVYLARRQGVDGYVTNVALKLFYRHPTFSKEEYLTEMRRVALQAQRVSVIQHDNLISIRDFVALGETRVMVLEWVDGLDLARLLEPRRLQALQEFVSKSAWDHLNDVIVTTGEDHCRLRPGIAVDILRGCLEGLSSLHHNGIVHCDLKPSNIMIKRTGTKKIIDIDSSCIPTVDVSTLRGTPYYMAPEQLQGRPVQLQSDIASLGYILLEMLTGKLLFRDAETIQDLLEAKLKLPARLDQVLPPEVKRSAILRGLIGKMIAVDPKDRFPDADAAELDRRMGAVNFHRQLIKMDLSTEYSRELAWWLELLSDAGEV
ncbi:MAG TPA: serine/threonine-protein kinase [Planctomycetota bacterium]|nr:serine/threonine-protein kinase [Planctomycetota bacterium]